ncbi:LysR family transcriptional regulator [Providencia heimbachae]|uniref:LysR family transcriptional regulator n=1 Tax=Providencia heimbachae ATCC 35613 TaxID=1354272 RepID=A0A1B7K2S7_9GAMM|nr:LysR family transcriptional regulator [Providencia heimbachae]OAT54452.1 LysR family transcriptional regulator [Providencia heimbachae ATCC 35613]SQH13502.1 D-malate degradation protein R [Providencia heimbachae]
MTEMNVFPVLIAVADSLSVTKAAKSLNITKSAVSKAIQGVEDTLGVKLFYRTTRSISLTEVGGIYIDYIRQSYQLAVMAGDAVSKYSDKATGIIRVCAPMSFGILHLSRMIPVFMQQYPDLEVELFFDDKVTDLIGEGYDIAVRIGELPDSSLVARRLSPCHSGLYAAKNYLAQYEKPKKASELKNHNCLSYSFYQAGQEWVFYHKGKKFSHIPKGNLRVNNSQALVQAVIGGIGIALLPHFITSIEDVDNQLIPLLTDYELPDHSIYAVYPEKQYLPRKVAIFVEFLQKQFGEGSEYQQKIEFR